MNKKLNSLRVFTIFLTVVFPAITMMMLYGKTIQLLLIWLVVTTVLILRIKTIRLLFNESEASRNYIKSVTANAGINFVMLSVYFYIYSNVFLLFILGIYSLFVTYLFSGTVYKECEELIEKEF